MTDMKSTTASKDLSDICRIFSQILNNGPITAEEWDELQKLLLLTNDDSRSARSYLTSEAAIRACVSASQSPMTERLAKRMRQRFRLNEPLDLDEQRAFLNGIGSVLASGVHTLFGDRNFAGVQEIAARQLAGLQVSRNAGSHRGWCLHLTTEGSGRYECIRQQFVAQRGDLVLLSPDAPYEYRLDPNSDRWRHEYIVFQPMARLVEWINWPELGPNILHARVPLEDMETIENVFAATRELDTANDYNDNAMFCNLVEQVLIRVQKFISDSELQFRDTRCNDAKTFIRSNLRRPLSVDEIAQHVQLSRTQLSVLFKRATGQSVTQWMNDQRMALAVHSLLQTDHSIAAIADEVGFVDPLYFSRKFKLSMGYSPRDYRKKHMFTAGSVG